MTVDMAGAAQIGIDERDIHVLRPSGLGYPSLLLRLPSPPDPLYLVGTFAESDEQAIAVVGSRKASSEALKAAWAIGRDLAESGRTVVAGLAYGVDTAAHWGALSVPSGRTIAVIGTGVRYTYPPANKALDELIRSRGAVVSQYPPNQGPRPEAFARRNELIAGFAQASVIVVAAEKSGTRHEIDFTIAQHKPVIFWEPTMGSERWARQLVGDGDAVFAQDSNAILQVLGRSH